MNWKIILGLVVIWLFFAWVFKIRKDPSYRNNNDIGESSSFFDDFSNDRDAGE